MKKYLFVFILIAFPVSASTIYPIESWWQKVLRCGWHMSCYRTLGATITTIQGTDRISDSRAVINTNFSNLNNGKIENSTTSVASITTLSNLASVGTLTTGVWSATTIAIAKGGTASTAPSGILWGDGAGAYTSIGQGLSGQLLTSNGASIPAFASPSVDLTISYVWTGQHTIGTTSPIYTFQNATTTFTHSLAKVGIGTSTPSVIGLNVATDTYIGGALGIGVATTSNGNLRVSTYTQIDGTASTTNLIISKNCTGCLVMFAGSDSTPDDFTDDTNVIAVGFQPRYITYTISAADTDESDYSWGDWTDPEGDGTGQYSGIRGAAAVNLHDTGAAHTNGFTNGKMTITFINFTSTGFSIFYDKQDSTWTSNATVYFTAFK